jgi:hypothetical protein
MLSLGLRLIQIALRSLLRNLIKNVGKNKNKIRNIFLRKPYIAKQLEIFVLPEPQNGIKITERNSDLTYQNVIIKGVYPYQVAGHILS